MPSQIRNSKQITKPFIMLTNSFNIDSKDNSDNIEIVRDKNAVNRTDKLSSTLNQYSSIIQINLKKSINFTYQLVNQMNKHSINIAAIQEPYNYRDVNGQYKIGGFGRDFDVLAHESTNVSKAALVIRRNSFNFIIDRECTNENFVVALVDDFVVVSAYFNLVNEDNSVRQIDLDLTL